MRTSLALAAVLCSLALFARHVDAAGGLNDEGQFFSPAAEQKATADIAEIARAHHGKDVLIETFYALPEGQSLRAFAIQRAEGAKLNGLYVIIVRKGGQVGVLPDSKLKALFTPDVVEKLAAQLREGLRKGTANFDPTLAEFVTAVRHKMDEAEPVAAGVPGNATAAAATRPARSRTDQLFDALTSDVPELRKAAADVLRASAADPATADGAVPRLTEMLKAGDPAMRVQAADLLGEIAKGRADLLKPAVPRLLEALRDNGSNQLRRAAARALGQAGKDGGDAVKGALKTAAENDADTGVREEAAAALRAIESPKP